MYIGFFIKKLLSPLVTPSGLVFLSLFLGLFIWPLRRKRILARNLFFLALAIYWVASAAPLANYLIRPLETRAAKEIKEPLEPIDTAVVLCGGVSSYSAGLPILDRLLPATRVRLLRTLQLLKTHPDVRTLIISGGCAAPDGDCAISEAELAYMWLQELGLPDGINIVLEKQSRDTEENIGAISYLVRDKAFYLVTSAVHIPRAMFLASEEGLKAYPVPCDYKAIQKKKVHLRDFWPNPSNLVKADVAAHEYLGLLWAHMKRWFRIIQANLA